MGALILGILAAIALIIVMSALKVGADADFDESSEEQKKELFISKCEVCDEAIAWTKDEPLVKQKYGTEFILQCPHCGKLTKVFIDIE